jgi:hypothetical protein
MSLRWLVDCSQTDWAQNLPCPCCESLSIIKLSILAAQEDWVGSDIELSSQEAWCYSTACIAALGCLTLTKGTFEGILVAILGLSLSRAGKTPMAPKPDVCQSKQ